MNMVRCLTTVAAFIGSVLLLAGPGSAQPVTGHSSNDAVLDAVDIGSVAQGRIGDRGGLADTEIGLGPATDALFFTEQFDWMSGETHDWTLSYEPQSVGGAVTFELGGFSRWIPTVTPFNSFFIRTSAELPNTSIRVSSLSLGPPPSAGGGGTTIFETASPLTPARSVADGNAAQLDILKISNVDLLTGFTLKGQVTMVFALGEGQPEGEQLVFEVFATDDLNPPGVVDSDGDGIPDDGDDSGVVGDKPCADGETDDCDDNCKDSANPDQANSDGGTPEDDTRGDVCDNCPFDPNPGQEDGDRDGAGDACDNCPLDCTPFLPPLDNCKNAPEVLVPGELPVQPDDDSDGVGNKCDNCRTTPNGPDLGTCIVGVIDGESSAGQECTSDDDCGTPPDDGVCSLNQENSDGEGLGDVCEPTIVSLLADGTSPVTSGATAASMFVIAAAGPVDLQLRLFCGPRNIAFANIGILLPSADIFNNFGGCTDETSPDFPKQKKCTGADPSSGLGETVSPASSTQGPEIPTAGISDRFIVLRLQGSLDRGLGNLLLCEAFDATDLTKKTNVELGILRLTDLPPDSAPQLSEDGLAALGLELLIDATNTVVAAAEIESSVDVSGSDPVLVTMSVNPNFDDNEEGRRFAVTMESPLEIGSMAFGLRGPTGILPEEMIFGACSGGPVTAADGTVMNTCTGGTGNPKLGPGVADSGGGNPPVTFTVDPNHLSMPAGVPSDTLMVALMGKLEMLDGDSLNNADSPTLLGVVEYIFEDPETPPQDPPTVDFQGATALPGVTVAVEPLDGTVATNQVARVGGGNADRDSDSDNRGDNADNCPNWPNQDQLNQGGLRFVGSGDFIGDLCTCGDSTGDGVVDDTTNTEVNEDDVVDCQALLALPPGEAEQNVDAQRCSVSSGEDAPNIIDIVVLELDLVQPGSAGATIEQVCVPAN
jgi:hypothetical protein